MTEWVIALGVVAVILLIAFIAIAKRCTQMSEQIQKMHQYTDDLKGSVRYLRAENEQLRSQVYAEDTHRITALKLELHLKQERIDALQMKLARQQQLLRQKWEGSKKCL